MTGPYSVAAGEADNTHRVVGPGLSVKIDPDIPSGFESTDRKIAALVCDLMCRSYRAGVRSNQDAIKRALDIQL